MIFRFLILIALLVSRPLFAIVLQGEPVPNQNTSFGSQVAKSTGKAKKAFKDVDCKKIGCKDVKQDFYDDSEPSSVQKSFQIKPKQDDEGPL